MGSVRVAASIALMMVAACQSRAPSNVPASLGPLALAAGENGDLALTTGVLRITSACTLLEYSTGSRVTLIWPAARTTWDGEWKGILHRNTDGTIFTLLDGDRVSFGGSGTTGDVMARMNWVQRPDPSCPRNEAWFLNEVVVPESEPVKEPPPVP